MKTCKANPLKLNEHDLITAHKQGRYVKRYYFSNGLGASVACHSGFTAVTLDTLSPLFLSILSEPIQRLQVRLYTITNQ